MTNWAKSSTFYHIYPLGLCGAPRYNQGERTQGNRMAILYRWLDAIQDLGCDAIYLGPVFESYWHGYDTSDYYQVDRRLGTNQEFKSFSEELHRRGMRLVLDGVFNHTGREFWAFQDLLKNGQSSVYQDWYVGVDFSRGSPKGDPFDYATWEGAYSLPKLNLHNPDVRQHLFNAVCMWMDEFQIDGLRLDAADCVEPFFWKELHQVTKSKNPEFWLMGEIIHGDYRQWANEEMFDSVTNYTAYKGLWSSLNDGNYWEIAYTLEQQFGQNGILQHLHLYNFVDNHDVSRVASLIKDPALLHPLYINLFTMPGIPSIYYGSEFGVPGRKEEGDEILRKEYNLSQLMAGDLALRNTIKQLAKIRNDSQALLLGDYRKLFTAQQQIAYARSVQDETMVIMINSAPEPVEMNVPVNGILSLTGNDVLNHDENVHCQDGYIRCTVLPRWGRVIKL